MKVFLTLDSISKKIEVVQILLLKSVYSKNLIWQKNIF